MNIIPRECDKCGELTNFGISKYSDSPRPRYCMECYIFMNLSVWNCDKCKTSGKSRVHKLNFITRFLVLRGWKNIYKNCQCGNKVELTQQ